jgi:hypothetical protein
MWSVCVDRHNSEHRALHSAISGGILKPLLDATDYARLTGELDDSLADVSWVDKLPTPRLADIRAELVALVDQYVSDAGDLRFQWQLVRDHLVVKIKRKSPTPRESFQSLARQSKGSKRLILSTRRLPSLSYFL